MAPYKINRNKKPLTDEQIERHKSFSSLLKTQQELHQYKALRKPLYKNYKVLSVIVVALTVVLILVLESIEQDEQNPSPVNKTAPANRDSTEPKPDNDTSTTNGNTTGATSPAESMTTPVALASTPRSIPASMQLPFTTYQVNAEKGAVLYPGNGNRILIPANAFKDATGKLVTGNVQIQYREFRNSFDFFRGGIPMHWKDGQCLVSNGMFEILGSQNGKPITIAKSITVDLLTVNQKEEYQLYYFDENKKEWIEKGKENKRETFFTSTSNTPMSVFNDLTWELVTPMDPQKLMSIFRTPWSDATITKMEGDLFTLSLTLDEGPKSQKVSLQATLFPIYTQPSEHSAWLKTLYQNYTAAQKQQTQAQLAADKAYQKYINSEEYKKNQAWMASPEYKKMQLSGMIYTRFVVNNFGTWNCDRPQNLPKGALLKATFKDENKKTITPETIYLVDYEMNSTFNYYPEAFNKFSFNPAHSNILWCVLDENHIGIFKKESFKNVPKSGTYTFVLSSTDVSGMNGEDFNKLFSLSTHTTTSQQIEAQNKVNVPERTIVIISTLPPLAKPSLPKFGK